MCALKKSHFCVTSDDMINMICLFNTWVRWTANVFMSRGFSGPTRWTPLLSIMSLCWCTCVTEWNLLPTGNNMALRVTHAVIWQQEDGDLCMQEFGFCAARFGCLYSISIQRACVRVTVHSVCGGTVQIAPFIGKLSFGSVWYLGFRLSSLLKKKRSLCGVTFSFPWFLSQVYLITRWHLMPALTECTIAKFRFFFSTIPFECWQRSVRLISVWTAVPSCLWLIPCHVHHMPYYPVVHWYLTCCWRHFRLLSFIKIKT